MSELIDNRAHRIRTLKTIVKQLHEGVDPETVRSQLAAIVRETDASEIAAMEQQLLADGITIDEVKSMCDLHGAVLKDIIQDRTDAVIPPGHPVDTFRRENEAILDAVRQVREAFAALTSPAEGVSSGESLATVRDRLNPLMDVDKHYKRKENLLFSCLERHGITGPSKVMWAKDDEVRERLDALGEALRARDLTAGELEVLVEQVGEPALVALEGMVEKEEKILLPMAIETLNADEWGEIWTQSPEYGWCIVEPLTGYEAPEAVAPSDTLNLPAGRAIILPTGSLNREQLLGLFSALPVDVTFVDADDRVRFFSEGQDRVFARSKAIIGRKVHNCHPPKSVDVVERIVADFRSGQQDVAEFWIEMEGRFVYIRYFAVRDDADQYLGTLEVTQDITRLRQLSGERRLLEYDKPMPAES